MTTGHPKVSQDNPRLAIHITGPGLGEEYVFGFDIPVDYIKPVKILRISKNFEALGTRDIWLKGGSTFKALSICLATDGASLLHNRSEPYLIPPLKINRIIGGTPRRCVR